MPDSHAAIVAPHPWTIEQIAFDRIAHDRIAHEETWFHVLAAASFVESLADLYTHNLLDHMKGDAEASQWLRERWEPEELQHGRALRRYVETVWPAFDWQTGGGGGGAGGRPGGRAGRRGPARARGGGARGGGGAGAAG